MGVPELNRTGARAWAILVFRQYLAELSKTGKLRQTLVKRYKAAVLKFQLPGTHSAEKRRSA